MRRQALPPCGATARCVASSPISPWSAAVYILGNLRWYEALVVSLTAFHKPGFFSQQYAPGDPQSILAAVEAVFGLLIEIRFIATFT